MKLFTAAIKKKLLDNSLKQAAHLEEFEGKSIDLKPVAKLFGGAAATWLITEMDQHGMIFALCDLGLGCPELGYVHMDELTSIASIQRDLYWKATKTLSEYAGEARAQGRIAA